MIEEQEKNKKKLLITIVGLITLVIAVVGISYAAWNYVFNGSLTNTISTPEVSIELLESNDNIINITNALPMSDNQGKAQTQVFDFVVTSKTTKDIDIDYTINLQKLEVDSGYTSLSDNQIKVYLTDNNNTQKVAPTLISNLNNYKLYKDTHSHDSTHNKVQSKYKLRVWIDQDVDASSWNASTKLQYKFKIGVTSTEKQKSAYPEVVYRYGTNIVKPGASLTPATITKWIITDGTNIGPGPYDTLEECQTAWEGYKTQGMPEGWTCQQKTETFEGFDYSEDYTTLNKNYFLKHNISSSGTVESSEVCYILNNTLYCLKGGDGGTAYSENTSVLQNSFGQSNCSVSSYDVYCSASGLDASADRDGSVGAGDASSSCGVHEGGVSFCGG